MRIKHSHKWVHKATSMGQVIPPDAPTDKDGYLILDTPMIKEIEYRCSNLVKAQKSILSETMKRSGVNYLPHTKGEACNETLKIIKENDILTEVHFEGKVINDTKTIEVWRTIGW